MTRGSELGQVETFADFLRAQGLAAPSKGARRDVGGEASVLEAAWRGGRSNGADLAALACADLGLPPAAYVVVATHPPLHDGL